MIFSCGEALIDLVPDPVPGGGPMNVAIAAARMGAPASFVGGISTDPYGELLWEHLVANGVDLSLARRFDAPTAKAIVEHVPELRFRFEGDDTADTLLDAIDSSSIGRDDIVHGGTLGMFRGRSAETYCRLAEAHGGTVSFDPNIRPQIIDDRIRWMHFHDRWLRHVDIYKGSDEDLDWIYSGRDPESVAAELLEAGVTAVIVTRGADGLQIITAGGVASATPPPVVVVDTVGAGDTIVGAVLVSLHESNASLADVATDDWQLFAERAVAAAAVTVSRVGADVPRRDELDW